MSQDEFSDEEMFPWLEALQADEPERVSALTSKRRFIAGIAGVAAVGTAVGWGLLGADDKQRLQTSSQPNPHAINLDGFNKETETAGVDLSSAQRATRDTVSAPSTTTSTDQAALAADPAGKPTTSQAQDNSDLTPTADGASSRARSRSKAGRILVIVELAGGNDGLSTVVPYSSGTYYDLRPSLGIRPKYVHKIDNEVGLHPQLGRLSKRKFAVVEGIGNTRKSLSHFQQAAEWRSAGTRRRGYIAQVADCLSSEQTSGGLVAVSASGFTPQLELVKSDSLSVSSGSELGVLDSDRSFLKAYGRAINKFGDDEYSKILKANLGTLIGLPKKIDVGQFVAQQKQGLKGQLDLAAEFIEADMGVRVIHAELSGFDTHNLHYTKHSDLMAQLDVAVDGFLDRMELAGMKNKVLVACTSEFGRRVKQNGTGLDHGNGSTMMLFGPVKQGRHGVPANLKKLDNNGNLKTQVSYKSYLRTLAHDWLGCEGVLDGTESIKGLV